MVAYVIFIKERRTTKESSIFTTRWLPPLSRVIRSRSASRTDTRNSFPRAGIWSIAVRALQ